MIVRQLESEVRGDVLRPGEDGYDEARRVFNGMVDRRPAVILRCTTDEDVVAGVGFARQNGLVVAVKGAGHNVAGNAVCDGGLVIDLSRMRDVRVDPGRRRAICQGGATWGDFDRATQAHGLATPGGIISSTGVAGRNPTLLLLPTLSELAEAPALTAKTRVPVSEFPDTP